MKGLCKILTERFCESLEKASVRYLQSACVGFVTVGLCKILTYLLTYIPKVLQYNNTIQHNNFYFNTMVIKALPLMGS